MNIPLPEALALPAAVLLFGLFVALIAVAVGIVARHFDSYSEREK